MAELTLAQRLASARNYAYEATMNEYSQASINRAVAEVRGLLAEAARAGLIQDDLVLWSHQLGRFIPRD